MNTMNNVDLRVGKWKGLIDTQSFYYLWNSHMQARFYAQYFGKIRGYHSDYSNLAVF